MEHAELFGVLYIFIKNFPIPHQKRFPIQDDTHDSPEKFLIPPPKKNKKHEVSIFFLPTLKLRNRSFYAQQNLVSAQNSSRVRGLPTWQLAVL